MSHLSRLRERSGDKPGRGLSEGLTRTLRISSALSRFCSCSWSAEQPSAANHVRASDPAASVDGSAVPEQEQKQEQKQGQVENCRFEERGDICSGSQSRRLATKTWRCSSASALLVECHVAGLIIAADVAP